MVFEYAGIAYGGQILVEDKPCPLQFNGVVKKLVENAARHDTRASYQYEGNMYSTMVENEILYLVVSDKDMKTLSCFHFIGDMQHKFKAALTGNPNTYPKPAELVPQRCATFAPTMQNLVKTYSENPDHNNKMVKLKTDIEVVKTQMLENIDMIVKRGGDIERLCDKTQMLEEDAVRFERRSHKLANLMFWRNVKIVIAIVLVIIVFSFIISMIACGATFKKCKSDTPPPAATPNSTTVAPTTAAPMTTTTPPTTVVPTTTSAITTTMVSTTTMMETTTLVLTTTTTSPPTTTTPLSSNSGSSIDASSSG